MSGIIITIAALYLATGAFWWRRIVLPGPVLGEPEDWRVDLAHSAQSGDVALFIVKGAFVLLWPLALGGGWLSARFD